MSEQKDGVVVPREPTEEMLRAAAEESGMWCEPHEAERESGVEVEQSITPEDAAAINEHTYDMLRSQYKAMIDAAPSHPQEKDAGRDVVIASDNLYTVTMPMCGRCLLGEGGECHSPGCAFYLNRAPDLPIQAMPGYIEVSALG